MQTQSINLKCAKASLADEAQDLLRGAAGGLIFGTPLLYTMEMWFHGITYSPAHLLGLLVLVSIINIGFSYASGLRAMYEKHSLKGAFSDTITALALGFILAAIVLFLIGQIPHEGFEASVRKIIIIGAAFSLGITFTNTKFPGNKSSDNEKDKKDPFINSDMSIKEKQRREDLKNLAAAAGGALIFAFNVAPTEEITLLATIIEPKMLFTLFMAEIVICYIILYAAKFKDHPVYNNSIMQHPFAEVAITVTVSLFVAGALICLISYDSALSNIQHFIANVIVLGFPAIIGGSAGRVIL